MFESLFDRLAVWLTIAKANLAFHLSGIGKSSTGSLGRC